MNCQEARERLLKQQGSPGGEDVALRQHLETCESCREFYEDHMIGEQLRRLETPEPRPGFEEEALRRARLRGYWQQWHFAIPLAAAAAILLAVTVALIMEPWQSAGTTDTEIAMTADREKTVRVLIETTAERRNATLTIDLAENLEIKGYPDRRQLVWQTDLKQGKNLLALPLVLREPGDGYINIVYRHGDQSQTVRITVSAGSTDSTSRNERS
ncbi:MAG: hypothetical protein WD572_06665 [Gammaproteobacteria bacterium]